MISYAILLGGTLVATPRLKRQLAGARFIAADGGMAHAALFAAQVELWVGDFDSTDKALARHHAHVERQAHPAAKDATDGELAIEAALQRGAEKVILVGGLGGASDHALAHLTQLLALAGQGIACFASSGDEEAWPLLPGEMTLDSPPGTRMSVIGFSPLKAISLSGVRWPLDRRDVPLGSSLTMSNEITSAGAATISLEAGHGVTVLTFKPQD